MLGMAHIQQLLIGSPQCQMTQEPNSFISALSPYPDCVQEKTSRTQALETETMGQTLPLGSNVALSAGSEQRSWLQNRFQNTGLLLMCVLVR